MKFSTIALALATIFIATSPSALLVSAEYVCHIDTFFTFDSDSDLTTTPSQTAQEFLRSVMVDTFNEAYVNVPDFYMDSDIIEDVSI